MSDPSSEPVDGEASPGQDQIVNAHALLASYPFASATPTVHVARHLGPMSLPSPIPSLAQPHLARMGGLQQPNNGLDVPSPQFPGSTLWSDAVPTAGIERQFWEQQREMLIQNVYAQANNATPRHAPQDPPPTLNSQTIWAPSSYKISPLASSVLQSTAHHSFAPPLPPNLAPTPSSLSNALGHTSIMQQPRDYQGRGPQYTPDTSQAFFDSFLASTLHDLTVANQQAAHSLAQLATPAQGTSASPTAVSRSTATSPISSRTVSQRVHQKVFSPMHDTPRGVRGRDETMPESSPGDPMALHPGDIIPYIPEPHRTPSRKRKLGAPDDSASMKRIQPTGSLVPVINSPQSNSSWRSSNGKLSGSQSAPKPDIRQQSVISATTHHDAALHDYDDEDASGSEYFTPLKTGATPSTMTGSPLKISTGRTLAINRDDRVPLQKLASLLEDVFEAEDSLAPDADTSPSLSQLPASFYSFFSSLTSDASRPLLNGTVVAKLSHLVGQVARPSKRTRRQAMSSPLKPKRSSSENGSGEGTVVEATKLSEIDPQILNRTLKLLERSVILGEDLDPFAATTPADGDMAPSPLVKIIKPLPSKTSTKKKAPKEKRSSRSRSRSGSHANGDNGNASDDAPGENTYGDPSVSPTEPSLEELSRLGEILEIGRESVAAATCCIAFLAADALPKAMYSEELISACMSTIKNQLTKVIYPFVEGLNDVHGHNTPMLDYITGSTSHTSMAHRKQIGAIFLALTAAFPQIDAMVRHSSAGYISMSDAITIHIIYIAIGPFFVVESSSPAGKGATNKDRGNVVLSALGGTAAIRGLRLSALSLIRSVFEINPEQRGWIFEEILTSLIKLPDLRQKTGQFRLRDGRAIHTVTALLLQLIQTSAHDTSTQAYQLTKKRQELAVRVVGSSKENQENAVMELDQDELKLYMTSLDTPYNFGMTIFVFLTQRAGKGKGTKNTNESEYRAILDTLIGDLMTVLYWPEWPAASLLLTVVGKLLGKALDDVKSTAAAATDMNGLRAIALDHLGAIAARLRAAQLRNLKTETDPVLGLPPLETIVARADLDALDILTAAHEEIRTHLTKFSAEDAAINESAVELNTTIWAQEIAVVILRTTAAMEQMTEQGLKNSKEYNSLVTCSQRLRGILRDIWKRSTSDVFTAESDSARIDTVAETIGVSQGLRNAFEPILTIIISALDASAVFMRTKALRALGLVLVEDPDILRHPNVRQAIQDHLSDSSPAVRDAAVELIGKYVIFSPIVVGDYYHQIAERIADTGLGVRKRVIKLLKSIHAVDGSRNRRIDICYRLVMRMLDEDDTVKDLAAKTISELWFQPVRDDIPSKSQPRTSTGQDILPKDALGEKVSVIMGVIQKFPDRQSPLESVLHQLVGNSDSALNTQILASYEEITDALIEMLVDAQDAPGFSVVYCIKSIHVFTTALPSAITSSKALTLLPYLKNPTTSEEQNISDYLLRVYRLCIPSMPKTATKFGSELQAILQPMVIKPSSAGGLTALQETVATLCTVVQHITHDFTRLVGLLKSCNSRLQSAIHQSSQGELPPATLRNIILLIYILSLLCEHCDFDALRESDRDIAKSLDAVSKDGITLHVYRALLSLHGNIRDPGARSRLMQCLGFLFRSYPALMTTNESAALMDTVFVSHDVEARARLLRIIQDFLMSESSKFMTQENGTAKSKSVKKNVNMEELVGNTTEFADSGVSSAVVQRYFPQILECTLTNNPVVQGSAVDILGFVVRQGLAHPIQCVSAIIALETSPIPSIASRALSYHTLLYNKHATMLNARQLDSARKSFEYQQRISSGPVCGFRTEPHLAAVLSGWYSLVREKRASRQDFLKAVLKCLDLEVPHRGSMPQSSLDFIRYIAENFATLEYKTQEEVLTVIRHLTSVISVTGVHLVEVLQGRPNQDIVTIDTGAMQISPLIETSMDFSRTCACIAVLLVLKGYLKTIYGLTEDKCSKWIPGKKSVVGDKAATRRRETPISWDMIPFAIDCMLSSADQDRQHKQLIDLWEAEGVTPEPLGVAD